MLMAPNAAAICSTLRLCRVLSSCMAVLLGAENDLTVTALRGLFSATQVIAFGGFFSPPPCGEGSGGGVERCGTLAPQSPDAPPRPSPPRREGEEAPYVIAPPNRSLPWLPVFVTSPSRS